MAVMSETLVILDKPEGSVRIVKTGSSDVVPSWGGEALVHPGPSWSDATAWEVLGWNRFVGNHAGAVP